MLEARAAAMCAKAKAYAMAQASWGLFVLWVPCFSASLADAGSGLQTWGDGRPQQT